MKLKMPASLACEFRGQILENEPMARHTTWGVGGPADLMLVPRDQEDLCLALAQCSAAGIPWYPLGGGSNLLVRDGGVRGAVIDCRALTTLVFEGTRVQVGAGVSLARLIRSAVELGLGGLEELWGIPGSVGGALAGNAGAGGCEIGSMVRSLQLCSKQGVLSLGAEELNFSYRQLHRPERSLICAATLEFRPAHRQTLEDRLEFWRQQRLNTQETGRGNAGSVFKNPPGRSAWKLIEEAGCRGLRRGGARVSMKHANFILNEAAATAAEIEALMEDVRSRVLGHSGIRLETEVRIWGEAII